MCDRGISAYSLMCDRGITCNVTDTKKLQYVI